MKKVLLQVSRKTTWGHDTVVLMARCAKYEKGAAVSLAPSVGLWTLFENP